MEIRYDFAKTLDLTYFRKQAKAYIGKMRELTYFFYLQDHKIIVQITTPDNYSAHMVQFTIYEIKRDAEQEIIEERQISPPIDQKFQAFKNIIDIFTNGNHGPMSVGQVKSSNNEKTVDIICDVIKTCHKIKQLGAFL